MFEYENYQGEALENYDYRTNAKQIEQHNFWHIAQPLELNYRQYDARHLL